MKKYLLLFVFMLFAGITAADDYSFDISEIQKKPYEFSGDIRFNSFLSRTNQSSDVFKLKYYSQTGNTYIYGDYLKPELFFKYKIRQFSYNISGNAALSYSDNQWQFDKKLYENYISYKTNNLSFEFGKRSLKWGKGYIWNPTNYAGRQKNIDDVDAALEGYYLLNAEWIKSFDSKLSNLALDFVVLPSDKNINNDYTETNAVNYAAKAYFLVYNTDIDFYLLLNTPGINKVGMDLSKNIESNWEMHFEFSRNLKNIKYFMNSSGVIEHTEYPGNNFLLGTRYLTNNEITIIFEYFHNFTGFTKEESDNFYEAIAKAISSGKAIPYYKQNLTYLNQQFISKDYLYLKFSWAQPYDILYFTPALYSVINLSDKSQSTTLYLSYSGITNLETIFKYSLLTGASATQFGTKIISDKLELQLKYYF